MDEDNTCYSEQQLMFISEFLSDTKIGFASLILLVYLTINYNDKIEHFTNNDEDKLNWFGDYLVQFPNILRSAFPYKMIIRKLCYSLDSMHDRQV